MERVSAIPDLSNSAFTFNGINSQVSIPDNALIEPGTGSWTIEVWLNNSGSSGTVCLESITMAAMVLTSPMLCA